MKKTMELQKQEYYLAKLPKEACYKGDIKKGEIELVTDPQVIAEIVQNYRHRLSSLNLPNSAGEIGIVLEDEYIIVVRDPVKFPSGTTGTYLRIFERSGLDGPDGIIYLRMVFVMLHVTGNWNVLSEAVKQEITEEFGFIKLTEGFSKSMLSSKITKGG